MKLSKEEAKIEDARKRSKKSTKKEESNHGASRVMMLRNAAEKNQVKGDAESFLKTIHSMG